MKLLLDEMFSPLIAERLRERGHDVIAIKGTPDYERYPDRVVMDLARAQERAVVTNNLSDFRPLHNEAVAPGGLGYSGMVFVPGNYRRSRDDTGRIVEALEAKLAEFPADDGVANGGKWL